MHWKGWKGGEWDRYVEQHITTSLGHSGHLMSHSQSACWKCISNVSLVDLVPWSQVCECQAQKKGSYRETAKVAPATTSILEEVHGIAE